MFLVLAVVMALPALASFVIAYIVYTGCFLGCTQAHHGPALMWGALGLVFVALPFIGVRFFQSTRLSSAPARLAVIIVLAAAVVFEGRITGLIPVFWW